MTFSTYQNANNQHRLRKRENIDIELKSEIDSPLVQIVMKCLQKFTSYIKLKFLKVNNPN